MSPILVSVVVALAPVAKMLLEKLLFGPRKEETYEVLSKDQTPPPKNQNSSED